jgi:hypothetical protein
MEVETGSGVGPAVVTCAAVEVLLGLDVSVGTLLGVSEGVLLAVGESVLVGVLVSV